MNKHVLRRSQIVDILRPLKSGLMQFEAFDAEYVERLRSGDGAAESHFVRYFSDLILIKTRRRLRSAQGIEDVRQETFVRVFRALRTPEGIRHPDRLGAYVNSVCDHVLSEHLRVDRRRADAVASRPLVDEGPDPEAAFLSEDGKRRVREVIRELPPRDRDLLAALFLREEDKAEVCRRLGVSRDYLRVLLHRAKLLFRNRYLRRELRGEVVPAAERFQSEAPGTHGTR
jgi:RNA polymerase sigma-70 factor, ECF subfamily